MQVGVLVVGQLPQPRAVPVDDVQVGETVVEAGEDEPLPVGRPLRRLQPAQADADAPLLTAARHVENHEVIAVFPLGGDRERVAVGRKRACRIDEAQALVVAVLRGLHEPLPDAPGLGIRQPQVDEKPALVAEERQGLTIRRQRGGQEDAPVRAPLGQCRLRDPAGAIVISELRQERHLNGVAPVVRQVLERTARGALEGGIEPRGGGAL